MFRNDILHDHTIYIILIKIKLIQLISYLSKFFSHIKRSYAKIDDQNNKCGVKYIFTESEKHELFSNVTNNYVWNDFQYVETDSLAKRSAFTDDDDISFLNVESWWAVNWNVSVSLFISVVFWDVVKIISSDDNGSLHFSWDANTLENFTSDWDVAGEWAFFINVSGFDSFLWGSESKTDVFEISDTTWGLFG